MTDDPKVRAGEAIDPLAPVFERLAKHKNGDVLAWTPEYSKWRMLKDIDLALAEVERWRASSRAPEAEELKRWREWAQFVYLGGGPLSGTDAELRANVCEAHDAEVLASRASAPTEAPTQLVKAEAALQAIMQVLGPSGVPDDVDYGQPENLAGLSAEITEALRICRAYGITYRVRKRASRSPETGAHLGKVTRCDLVSAENVPENGTLPRAGKTS